MCFWKCLPHDGKIDREEEIDNNEATPKEGVGK
jgi:hypothetical protein